MAKKDLTPQQRMEKRERKKEKKNEKSKKLVEEAKPFLPRKPTTLPDTSRPSPKQPASATPSPKQAENGKHVKQLSSNLRSMKFMARTNQYLMEKEAEQRKSAIEDEHKWIVPGADTFVAQQSVAMHEPTESFVGFDPALSSMRTGRRSFGGFNPEIERLSGEEEKQRKADDGTVSDAEMARVSSAMQGKGKGKNKRSLPSTPTMQQQHDGKFKVPKFRSQEDDD